MSVPSNSLYRFSMSPGWFHPRLNSAWNRCCASGHVSAVVNDVRPSRRLWAVGSETSLMSFFAAAMGRRSKLAIRRASASTKPSSSLSGSARLTYPYRSAVSPSKSFEPSTISSARPRPTSGGRRSMPPPPGCTPEPTSTCARTVFSRDANRMSQARTNSLPTPRTRPRILAMLTIGDLVRRTNVSIRAGRPGGFDEAEAPRHVGQIEVGKVEVGIRALEYDDTKAGAGVHSSEQILEVFEHSGADDVEGRVVEHDPLVRRCLLDDAQVRR